MATSPSLASASASSGTSASTDLEGYDFLAKFCPDVCMNDFEYGNPLPTLVAVCNRGLVLDLVKLATAEKKWQ